MVSLPIQPSVLFAAHGRSFLLVDPTQRKKQSTEDFTTKQLFECDAQYDTVLYE